MVEVSVSVSLVRSFSGSHHSDDAFHDVLRGEEEADAQVAASSDDDDVRVRARKRRFSRFSIAWKPVKQTLQTRERGPVLCEKKRHDSCFCVWWWSSRRFFCR